MDAAKQRCALGVGEDMQRRTPSGCDYFNLFFHDFFNKNILLVEIGPEGWTPTQQPP
jgi:hypothetical protein